LSAMCILACLRCR